MLKADPLAQFILLALVVILVMFVRLKDGRSVANRVTDAFKAVQS